MLRGTIVGSWPMMPFGVISEFLALQYQGTVTTKGKADIPSLAATKGNVDV